MPMRIRGFALLLCLLLCASCASERVAVMQEVTDEGPALYSHTLTSLESEMAGVAIRDAGRGNGGWPRPATAGKERDDFACRGDREALIRTTRSEVGLHVRVARLVGEREIQPFEAGRIVVGQQPVTGHRKISGNQPRRPAEWDQETEDQEEEELSEDEPSQESDKRHCSLGLYFWICWYQRIDEKNLFSEQ